MNSLIVRNYVYRWRYLIGICTALHVILTYANGFGSSQNFMIPFILFVGPVALSFDLAKGFARVILLLPTPRREIVRTWWWLGVGLPFVWIVAITFATHLVTLSFTRGTFQDWNVIWEQLILIFSCLSLMYFALTGLPTNPQEAQERSGRAMLFGALWGFSMGGSMILAMFVDRTSDSFEPYWWMILAFGIGMSRWGYLRTDEMLCARSTGRNDTRPGTPPAKSSFFDFDSAATGFKHFSTTTILQTLFFTIVFLAFMALFNAIIQSFHGMRPGPVLMDRLVSTIQSQGNLLVLMPCFFLATRLMAARVFRMLPLTPGDLSNQFIRLAAISLTVQCAVLFVIIAALGDTTVALANLPRFILTGCIGTLILPLLLRYAFKPVTLVIAFVFFSASGTLQAMYPHSVPFIVALPVAVLILLLSRYLICYVLTNSSEAYRHTFQSPFGSNIYGKG